MGKIIFYDDCELAGKPILRGTNHDVTNSWGSKQGSSNGTVTRSNEFARKGQWSYKHVLSNSVNDGWQWVKAELAWNFLPAGSPLGTVGDRTAFYRQPLGVQWFAASVLIPSYNKDFNTITSLLFNCKPVEDDYPTPCYLAMEQGRYWFYITKINAAFQSLGTTKIDCGPVVHDQWEDWVLHRNFTAAASGFVRLFKNGKLVAEYLGGNWKDDGKHSKEPYMQMGLYKWAFQNNWSPKPNVETVTMFMDEIRFGASDCVLEDFLINKPIVNIPPKVDALVQDPAISVHLKGEAVDPDGKIVSYQWEKISGGFAEILHPDQPITRAIVEPGEYAFRLTVTDDKGEKAFKDVPVSVSLGLSIK